jgi:hypothetical protein
MKECEMLNYLNETYNGSLVNMLTDSAYYCYTIRDTETGKFYSGSRGVDGRAEHDLLIKYFTSSTVVDFIQKLIEFPELFEFRIEYFNTRAQAFEAEMEFHQKYQVGKNPYFINSKSAGGTNCGAGTVLCKDTDGNTYRVTVEEFSSGKHIHVSKGMMNIRTETGIKKIYTADFDPAIHTTEFEDYVLALDTVTGKTCRIPKTLFNSDDRYVGITKGMVVAYDTLTNTRVSLSKDEFDQSRDRYVGNTYGLFSVMDKVTREKKMISKGEYDRTVHTHANSNRVVVYSLPARKTVTITKDEYAKNSGEYANQTTKVFFKVDGQFFKSKELLDQYYRKTRGKTVLKVSQFEMSNRFKDIESITREEHENGKD